MNNLIAENLKVLVFRSNIDTPAKANQVQKRLLPNRRIYRLDIDLKDIDNVLRVECHPDCSSELIEEALAELRFKCAELTYEVFD